MLNIFCWSKAFSKDGHSVTMTLKNKSSSITLGKVWRQELSFSDVKLINLLYKCRVNCPRNITCSRGGFVTEACQCLCPDGTSDCQVGKKAKSPEIGGKIARILACTNTQQPCFSHSWLFLSKKLFIVHFPSSEVFEKYHNTKTI